MAAPRPAASATAGTPGSNRCGGGRNVLPSIRTTSIIDPPVRKGGIASGWSVWPTTPPAGQEGPTPVDWCGPAKLQADPVRAEHLVPGEGQEVHAERGHVDRLVRHRLGAVGEHQRALLVRPPGGLGYP